MGLTFLNAPESFQCAANHGLMVTVISSASSGSDPSSPSASASASASEAASAGLQVGGRRHRRVDQNPHLHLDRHSDSHRALDSRGANMRCVHATDCQCTRTASSPPINGLRQ